MSEAFQYVRELADGIGPRPATTDAEAEAADYIAEVMRLRGLETERQDFVCPRTYAWAFVIYHLLTVSAAVASGWTFLIWPAFVVSVLVAIVMFMDLDTRWGLSSIMPKGPSQNIIAKHVPKARRGEKLKRVVIVAHYDSAKASLAFSPGMVKNFSLTFGLMKWLTVLVPVFIFLSALPITEPWDPWTWYVTIAVSAYLVVPLLINVHRELFMRATDGANDNASGVAAMLGVMEAIVPQRDGDVTATTQPMRAVSPLTAASLQASGGVREGGGLTPMTPGEEPADSGLLNYSPADSEPQATELPDDFEWADSSSASKGQASMELGVESQRTPVMPTASQAPAPSSGAGDAARTRAAVDLGNWADDTAGIETVTPAKDLGSTGPVTPTRPAEPARPWGEVETDFDGDGVADVVQDEIEYEKKRRELFGVPDGLPERSPAPAPSTHVPSAPPKPPRKGLWSRIRGRDKSESEEVASWLGVEDDFDARDAGKKIGSWDNFDEEDDMGFKGGWAGDDPIEDPDFASNEAFRIRKRVTETVDRALSEKEVWFVATGAEESGTWGMRALLGEFGDELRNALIINLDNIGSGTLHWVTREGMVRRYHCDRRLASAAKRVAREEQIMVKGRPYKGLSTDATPALARGFRAMSVMAFDINGRLPNWHWHTDTPDNVNPENIDTAVKLVTGIVRET